jgi:hypothetical protein
MAASATPAPEVLIGGSADPAGGGQQEFAFGFQWAP